MAKRVGVIVSPHSRERLLERFPELSERDATGLIYSEVQQAIAQRRTAKTKPRWAAWASRTSAYDGSRYAWNPEETRAYVIGRMKAADRVKLVERHGLFSETWIVRTVLPRNSEGEEDVAHVHRYRQEMSRRRVKGRTRVRKTKGKL